MAHDSDTGSSDLIHKKHPIPTPDEENIQQALCVVWQFLDQGQTLRTLVEAALRESVGEGMIEALTNRNLAVLEGLYVRLTTSGESMARDIVRRHRLAERLLSDVLALTKEQIDPNACLMEHVIGKDVEEAICILLGHPRVCPHELSIPRGKCCENVVGQTGPVVLPLRSLQTGQAGKIVYLSPRDRSELHKLMALGFVPGVQIRVSQTYPAFVISAGETMAAVDPVLAGSIFIRKKNES
ncbi:MAG: metal-dependent transcriptional regulator [Elusimicrobiota bacterium]